MALKHNPVTGTSFHDGMMHFSVKESANQCNQCRFWAWNRKHRPSKKSNAGCQKYHEYYGRGEAKAICFPGTNQACKYFQRRA